MSATNLAPTAVPSTAALDATGAERAIRSSAWLTLVGAVSSGPLAIALVSATRPQPPWTGVDAFDAAFHPLQTLPYIFGFLMVGGFIGLVASLHARSPDGLTARTTCGVCFVAVFGAMIFINYVIQTTFVPALLRESSPAARGLIEALTMSNPRSFGWALEMWGYAVLGIATWLVAPVLTRGNRERMAARLFALNAPVSVAGGVITAIRPGWVVEPAGLAAFVVWNVLVIAMVGLLAIGRRAG